MAITEAPAAVAYSDVHKAAECVCELAHKTPVVSSRLFSEASGAEVFLSAKTCSAAEPSKYAAQRTFFSL